MNLSIDPCPFCGGKCRLTVRDVKFKRNSLGEGFRKYRIRVICNRCNTTGSPVTTEFTNLNPYPVRDMAEIPFFRYYANRAIEAWHRRYNSESHRRRE
jgi:hypothetical protein